MEKWDYVYLVFLIESLILVALNILAAYVIFTSSRLRSLFNNILLLLLFVAHTVTGVFNLLRCFFVLGWLTGETTSNAITILRDAFTTIEVHFNVLLSMERFFAIRKPFLYARLTRTHAWLSIGVALMLSIVFVINRIFLTNLAFLVAAMFVFAGAIIITISNSLLYRSIQKQCREIAATIVDASNEKKLMRRKLVKDREMKSLKICLMIAASYLLTWLVMMSGYTIIEQVVSEKHYTEHLLFIFAIIGFSNGIWDVLIFFHWNSTALRKVRQILRFLPVSSSVSSEIFQTEYCVTASIM